MDLGDLAEYLDPEFSFDLRGNHYTVKPVAFPVYLSLMAAQAHAQRVSEGKAKLEDGPEDKPIMELAPTVLGLVFDELVAAGVDGPSLMLIARSAYLFQIGSGEIAKLVLQSGKAPVSIPEPDSESTSTTSPGSTSSGSATSTPPPDSTTDTPSLTKSKPRSPATKDATPVPA